FLKHTQCFSKPEVYDFNRCVDKGSIILNYLANNASIADLIPSLCCGFFDIIDCLERKGNEHCLHKTGPETGAYVANTANMLVREIIDLSCGQRKSLEECKRVESERLSLFANLTTPFEKIEPQQLGFFYPLIKIARKLDS
ncbi:hypothetical protein B4U79_07877, partial [Dinothrombium tinctorium]